MASVQRTVRKVFTYHYFIVGISLLMLASCSTKKNSFVNRNYHNLTARYNGYFNAKESVKEGVAGLEKGHIDDYSVVLDVYPDGSQEVAQAFFPQMDRAIKKCSQVIQRHSMDIKKIEHCNWIDDSFLLMGEAQFYKQEFATALETFDYVAKRYDKNEIKHDARLWLVRTYAELGRFDDGLLILDMIKNDKDFPKKLKGEYETVYADFFLKQKDYINGAIHLQKAISLTRKRKRRVRLMFILAQIYQKDGEYKKAGRLFEQVVKLNPPYEMAFNAKINHARALGADGGKASASAKANIRKQLDKMLRDDKNIEYFDQIHYTLAQMSLSEGKTDEALQHLENSVRSSTGNPKQKGLSYLLMADVHFDLRDYPEAQAYYDSSVTQLPAEYERYQEALNKKNSLTGLVRNLNVIMVEDSLQRIAKMGDSERDAFIEDLIREAIREEEEKQIEEEERARRSRELITQNSAQKNANTNPGSIGGWYFYNPTTLASGLAEFKTRWGDRPMEDNWRRSNKNTFGGFSEEEEADSLEASKTRDLKVKNIRDKQAYLKNIPITEEAMAQSESRLIEAYYQLAIIYKERLDDQDEAISTFKELMKRYPNNKYRAPVSYFLYLLLSEKGLDADASEYKNILLSEFPESEYAQLISNPNYVQEKKMEQAEAVKLYEQSFQAFKEKKYQVVLDNYQMADSLHKGGAYAPKFALLNALAIGNTRGTDSVFVAALEEVSTQYAYDDAGSRAAEILEAMKTARTAESEKDTTAVIKETTDSLGSYEVNMDEVHYFVMVVPSGKESIDKLKTELSDFNAKFHGLEKFTISAMILDPARQLIMVKGFENGNKAKGYYLNVNRQFEPLTEGSLQGAPAFVISAANFIRFYQQKDVEGYQAFFKQKFPL
ncbi:MAG: tetratricopeptide repeat protein [Flavobacteriales bacterium]|nr:tetratricopeptide repeat protein [Flavobacteriales bacterium]